MAVYLDLVMVLNFLVDFLLLLGTNRLAGFPAQLRRVIPAAVLGAVYGGACMLPDLRFLGNFLWRMVCLGLMAVIAFGWNCSAIKRGGIFILLSMTLGGIAISTRKSGFPVLILSTIFVQILCTVAFGGHVGDREYRQVKISYGGKTISVVALRDTGNQLTDPLTGESVLVVSAEIAQKLTGLSLQQIQNPMETIVHAPISGMRLIPFRSVGNPGGMLLALPFECTVEGKPRRTLVAFATGGLGRGTMYGALTGGTI